jgi:hypothetical protein
LFSPIETVEFDVPGCKLKLEVSDAPRPAPFRPALPPKPEKQLSVVGCQLSAMRTEN